MGRYDRRKRKPGSAVPLACLALIAGCSGASAQTAAETPAHLDTITVEAARHRQLVEQQVKSFVSRISPKPYDSSLARWQTVAPICPLVAGLPREDGEYILTRISSIAAAAGAPVAGLSRWDQAFLKALYHTEHTDRQQLAEIKTAMAEEIAPR